MAHPVVDTMNILSKAAGAPCVSSRLQIHIQEELEHLARIKDALDNGRREMNARRGRVETHVPGHPEDCDCTGCVSTRHFGSSDPRDHNTSCTCSLCEPEIPSHLPESIFGKPTRRIR